MNNRYILGLIAFCSVLVSGIYGGAGTSKDISGMSASATKERAKSLSDSLNRNFAGPVALLKVGFPDLYADLSKEVSRFKGLQSALGKYANFIISLDTLLKNSKSANSIAAIIDNSNNLDVQYYRTRNELTSELDNALALSTKYRIILQGLLCRTEKLMADISKTINIYGNLELREKAKGQTAQAG